MRIRRGRADTWQAHPDVTLLLAKAQRQMDEWWRLHEEATRRIDALQRRFAQH